ncbi:MAG: MATE family efflux transporter [Halococcoides sp.]
MQLLQVAYNLADTIFLGWYDPTAVAAINLAFPLLFFLISIAGGFTTAGSILVAQYTGSDSARSAGRVAGQTLAFVGVLSVTLAGIGLVALEPALAALPTDPATGAEVLPQMEAYLSILFAGIPFIFGFYVFSSVMRGYGDTRTPMAVMLVTVALNVVLDPIAIFGLGAVPEMGIQGAALASVFARGVATVAGVAILFGTDRGPAVGLADLRLESETVREIVSIGTPTAIEQSMTSSAMIVLTVFVAQFGPPVAAGYGVVNRLVSLVLLPALGMGRATNTLVGQNLGAEKPDRAARGVWLAASVVGGVMIVVAAIAAIAPEPIVTVFLQAETEHTAESIRHATTYLRIRAVEFAFMGVLQVVLGAFRGAGNTKTALAVSIVTLWIVRVPVTYALAIAGEWGPMGLWVGMALGDIVAALVAIPWFLRGTWREAVIDNESASILDRLQALVGSLHNR